MKKRLAYVLAVLLALAAGLAIARPVLPRLARGRATHAFYFWKTEWTATPALSQALAEQKIDKVYMRFFDVRWSVEAGDARPVSPLRFVSPPPKGVDVVPVVYLVNEVFRHLPYAQVEALAGHVAKKALGMAGEEALKPRELQIDCDWSDSTRRSYFHFAELLRRDLKKQGILLSATIRLHQIKYADRTGVPPVDRGMLMFYNFGRIQADSDHSSIFNAEDARRYSSYIGGYQLPLDVSLPLFSWLVHSRDGQILGLLEKIDSSELTAANGFTPSGANRFRAEKSFFFRGTYFMAGDLLLVEESSSATTRAAAGLARDGMGWGKNFATVALFDLDERNLHRYETHDLQSILAAF